MFNKFQVFSSTFILSLACIVSPSVSNAESSEDRISYTTTTDSIEVSWDMDSSYTKIFENDKELWSGTDSNHTINNLDSGEQQHLTIAYYNSNDKVIDFDYLRVNTEEGQNLKFRSDKDSSLEDVVMDHTYENGEVHLEWTGDIPNDSDKYTVTKNGEKIGTTSDNEFVDENVENDQQYLYEIQSKEKVSEHELEDRKNKLKKRDIEITPDIEKELSFDKYNVDRFVEVPSKDLDAHIDTQSIVNRYGIQYTTFIPGKYETVPVTGQIVGGDNRTFDPFHDSYRTRTAIMADFTNEKIEADPFMPGLSPAGIDVGETVLYDDNYNKEETRVQDSYVSDLRTPNFYGGTANWDFFHSVGIPLYMNTPPNIDYDYHVNIQPNGSGEITGFHDDAPSHEIAVYIPQSGASNIIYKKESESFTNLFPGPGLGSEFNASF